VLKLIYDAVDDVSGNIKKGCNTAQGELSVNISMRFYSAAKTLK